MISSEDSSPSGPFGLFGTKKHPRDMAAFVVCFRLYRRKGEHAVDMSSPEEQPWHQRPAGCGEIRSAMHGLAAAGFEVRI